MAYDRYENRSDRDWRGRDPEQGYGRGPGNREDDRGFFERAGDEIASWFGDDDAERRRREDEQRNRMHGEHGRNRDYDRGYGRDYDRDRQSFRSSQRDQDRSSSRPMNWTSSDRDYRWSSPRSSRDYERLGYGGQDRDFSSRGGLGGPNSSDYMSPTGPSFGYGGTYGAGSSGGYGSGGYGSGYGGDRGQDRDRSYRPMAGDYGRSDSQWGRDDYRNTSYAGSTRDNDRHYHAWRQRQLDDLDRDYEHYCRERQDRFENDFGSWRQDRMSKRQQLGKVSEHMDVVGSDGETVGKVDCVKGDHIILTKSDSDDNRHHKIDCSMVDAIEGDQIRLNMPAEEAKSRFKDTGKSGFFGRDEGDRDREERTNLERSFSGTYES